MALGCHASSAHSGSLYGTHLSCDNPDGDCHKPNGDAFKRPTRAKHLPFESRGGDNPGSEGNPHGYRHKDHSSTQVQPLRKAWRMKVKAKTRPSQPTGITGKDTALRNGWQMDGVGMHERRKRHFEHSRKKGTNSAHKEGLGRQRSKHPSQIGDDEVHSVVLAFQRSNADLA